MGLITKQNSTLISWSNGTSTLLMPWTSLGRGKCSLRLCQAAGSPLPPQAGSSCLSGVHRADSPAPAAHTLLQIWPQEPCSFLEWHRGELYTFSSTSASCIKDYNGILRAFSGDIFSGKQITNLITYSNKNKKPYNNCIAMPYNCICIIVMEKCYWHFERKKRISNSKCDNIFINSSAGPWSSEMPLLQKGQTPSMQKWMRNEAACVVPEISHCSGFNQSLQLTWKYNHFLVDFMPPTAAMVWLGPYEQHSSPFQSW